jgi:hypothetical protein
MPALKTLGRFMLCRRTSRLSLKPVLVQCAFAAARAKNTYLQAQFLRLKGRRGPKKGAIAVAASILTAVPLIVVRP